MKNKTSLFECIMHMCIHNTYKHKVLVNFTEIYNVAGAQLNPVCTRMVTAGMPCKWQNPG